MKTRTIPELLQILLDNENQFKCGLCGMIMDVYSEVKISDNELNHLKYYLNRNLPREKHGAFGLYSFPVCEWPPRKEWLEKQIEYSKNFES